MVIKYFALSFILINPCFSETTVGNLKQLSTLIAKIDVSHMRELTQRFVNESYPNRLLASTGHKKAQKFILDRISNTGTSLDQDRFALNVANIQKFYRDDFKKQVEGKLKKGTPAYNQSVKFTDNIVKFVQGFSGKEGVNIVWQKRGYLNPEKVLIVGAHYDSVAVDAKRLLIDPKAQMPGANDNATGVATALKLIELLKDLKLPNSVMVVFFDAQEFAYQGSRHFSEKFKDLLSGKFKDKVLGFFNLEMLGHDTATLDTEKRYGNYKVYISPQGSKTHFDEMKLIRNLAGLGTSFSKYMQFSLDSSGRDLGDSQALINAGVPTLSFSQNWESDYNSKSHHTSSDFLEGVNFKSLTHSARFIIGSVIAWAFEITSK